MVKKYLLVPRENFEYTVIDDIEYTKELSLEEGEFAAVYLDDLVIQLTIMEHLAPIHALSQNPCGGPRKRLHSTHTYNLYS